MYFRIKYWITISWRNNLQESEMIYQGYTNMYHYIFSFFPEKAYEYIYEIIKIKQNTNEQNIINHKKQIKDRNFKLEYLNRK